MQQRCTAAASPCHVASYQRPCFGKSARRQQLLSRPWPWPPWEAAGRALLCDKAYQPARILWTTPLNVCGVGGPAPKPFAACRGPRQAAIQVHSPWFVFPVPPTHAGVTKPLLCWQAQSQDEHPSQSASHDPYMRGTRGLAAGPHINKLTPHCGKR